MQNTSNSCQVPDIEDQILKTKMKLKKLEESHKLTRKLQQEQLQKARLQGRDADPLNSMGRRKLKPGMKEGIEENPGPQRRKRGGKRKYKQQPKFEIREIRGNLLPPRTQYKLGFSTPVDINNSGFVYTNIRYDPVYVYDIDPTIGSTDTQYLTFLKGMYRYYRTRSASLHVSFQNKEAFGVVTYLTLVNSDPNVNNVNYPRYMANAYSKTKALGPLTGNSAGEMRHRTSTSTFSGIRYTGQIDTYTGRCDGTAAPTNFWFFMVGAVSTDGTSTFTVNNGIGAVCRISIMVDFFEIEQST